MKRTTVQRPWLPGRRPRARVPRAEMLGLALWLAVSGLAMAVEDVRDPARDEPGAAKTADAAEPREPPQPPQPPTIFERILVTGAPDRLVEVPGSAHRIDAEELEKQSQTDLHRILRQVPGLNLQEEEGYGLRPNIGMRGTGVERSSKITLLEDGVLIAPAPYAAPAAYYVPTAARMSGFEVVKGAAAVRQGPLTTGGVVNMLSTPIPGSLGGRVVATYGDDATLRAQARVGDSRDRFGWLVEGLRFDTDGFKQLDGGGDTGVELTDYLAKLRFNSAPGSTVHQALELKAGRTEQLGHETYLGLTESDFRATPLRRYAASQQDLIDTEHEQVQARYFLQPSSRWDLTATAYRNDFFRNWHKLESVAGTGLAGVLDAPELHAQELAILRGESDSDPGALAIRNNRRDYYGRGAEAVVGVHFGGDRMRHVAEVGARYHEDAEDRFQEDDRWQMVDGRMVLTSLGAPGSNANRVSSAEALAFFIQDRIRAGDWVLRPGVRFESIDFERRDFGLVDAERRGSQLSVRDNQVDEWVPGLGVDYLLSDDSSLFVGVHKGFAPPGPGADRDTRSEESVNYEAGYRQLGAPFEFEAVGFYSDYSNLLGRDTLAGGGSGSGDLFNGGAVEVQGLELGAGYDLGRHLAGDLRLPLRLAYTWTQAEFRSSFETDFADWAPQVLRGDRLPYLPEHQVYASFGVERAAWHAALSATWIDAMRTSPGSGPIPAGTGTDSHLVLDVAGSYRLVEGLRLELQVRNLADETYVSARRPAGVRPGLPRTAQVGFAWSF